MIKAFFSYSTQDAAFVREVASEVGRAFAAIDYRSFHAGGEILDSIDEALRESAAFVIFLSKASLDRPWVRHEIREARFQAAMGRIKSVLVVRLSPDITPEDLPEWLNRTKQITTNAAKPAARTIRTLIDDLVRQGQSPRFVGRAAETEKLQDVYSTTEPGAESQIACVTGLPRIGRRATLTKMVRESLDLESLLVIDVEPGDTVQALAAKLSSLVDPTETPEESIQRTKEIAALGDAEALEHVLAKFQTVCQYHQMPVLHDEGGLLDNDGDIPSYGLDLIDSLSQYPDIVTALLTNRRPSRDRFIARGMQPLNVVHVRPLEDAHISRLVGFMAKARQITLTPATVKEITTAVRGYPPSVTFALELITTYGPELWRRRRMLSDFGASPLTSYLRQNKFSNLEKKVLRVMAANSPLPLSVLQGMTNTSDEGLDKALMHLIDVSLIVPTVGSWYEVSGPAVDAIRREFGACSRGEYGTIASRLDEFLACSEEGTDYLALQRTLFRAMDMAGQQFTPRAYALLTDRVKLADQYYYEHEYQRSVAMATDALDADPGIHQARTRLIRAHVKLGEFAQAEDHISELKKRGQMRDAFFLMGFLDRHRGEHLEALNRYQKALDSGYGGMAIHREMAECCIRLGNLPRAEEHISRAEKKQPDNRFVVDLKIQIACKLGDRDTALELLVRLADVDRAEMVSHRTSRVEYLLGKMEVAYEFAQKALAKSDNVRFEVLANYVLCALRTSRIDEASTALDQLDSKFKGQRRDIRTGLRARLSIAQQDYKTAYAYTERFVIPDRPVHLLIRRDALRGMLDRTALAPHQRSDLKARLKQCEDRLAGREEDFDLDARG